MRTITTLWTAAFAVVSLTGPFTTAEAAPARLSHSDRQLRPVFRHRSFNETEDANLELRDADALLKVSVPSSSSSAPGPTDPAHHEHHDDHASKHDHASPLPLSSSSYPAPTPASSSSGLSSRLTTLLHHTAGLSTGGLTTPLAHVTSDVQSVVSHVTATNGVGSIVTPVVSGATHAVPTGGVVSVVSGAGITGPGTGGVATGATGNAGSILSSVQSQVTPVLSNLGSSTSMLPAQSSPTASNSTLASALPSGSSSVSNNAGSTLTGLTPSVGSAFPNSTGVVGSSGPVQSIVTPSTTPGGSGQPTGPTGSVGPTTPIPTQTTGPVVPTTFVPPIITFSTGTGGVFPSSNQPTGGITITGPGTTVVVPIPSNTPGTSIGSTGSGAVVTTIAPTQPSTPIFSTSPGSTGSGSPTNSSMHTIVPVSTSVPESGSASRSVPSHSTTAVASSSSNAAFPSTGTSTRTTTTQTGTEVSIKPTGTDTRTAISLPTQLSFAPSSSAQATRTALSTASSAAQSSSAGIAPFMPSLVQPAGGMPQPGSDFSLIQIGFKYGLNYPFVVGTPESSMQIMAYLPKGLSQGLGIEEDQVLMNALMPYNTKDQLGYVTTLAQVYIPKDLVNQLQLKIHTSTSPIYYNAKPAVQQLMRMINPTIPILPGSSFEGLGPYGGFNGKAAAGAGPGSGQGAPIGSDAGTTNKVQSTSVGIAGAAVAGAAVYVASMMYMARRYRQRRKRHQRTSSVQATGEMTQRSSGGMGSTFMAGANGRGSLGGSMNIPGGRGSRTSNGSSNGRSIREQGISAPLMSENSLGWN